MRKNAIKGSARAMRGGLEGAQGSWVYPPWLQGAWVPCLGLGTPSNACLQGPELSPFFFGDKSLMLIWRDHHPRAPGTMHCPTGTITRHPLGCRYPVGTCTPRDVLPVSPEGDKTLGQTFFRRENMWGQLRVSPVYLIALQR